MTSATIFPDTTILVQYQSLDQIDWRSVLGVKKVKLMLTATILQEIKDIKNQEISPSLAKRAESVLTAIRALLNGKQAVPEYFQIQEAELPELNFKAEQLDPHSVADILVATVIAYQRRHSLEYVVLFSDDAETRVKAEAAGLEIASLPKAYLYGKENSLQVSAIHTDREMGISEPAGAQKLFTPSPRKLVAPTPLFKNKFIPGVAQVDETALAQDTSPITSADTGKNKLFEVIEPVEDAPSPVKAVEHQSAHQTVLVKEEAHTPVSATIAVDVTRGDITRGDVTSEEATRGDVTSEEATSEKATSEEATSEEATREEATREEATREDAAREDKPVEEPVKPARTSPFVDIKQERARPDNGIKKLFNLPKLPATPPVNGTPVTSPPPVIPEPSRRSYSFTSQSSARQAQSNVQPIPPEKEPPAEKAELRLAFDGDEPRSALIIHHPEYPTIDEVNESLTQLRKNYPKLALLGTTGGDGIDTGMGISPYRDPSMASRNDTVFQRQNARISRYNAALDAYYLHAEKYLSEVAEFQNLRRRSAQLNLMFINDFPDSLKSLYIAIHFPGNLRVYAEENLPKKPVGPSPPEEPDLNALFDRLRLPSVPVPGELSAGNQDIKMRSRNLAPMEVRWNKGWDVIYSMREIARGDRIAFNPLFIVFNSFEQATSFRIQYRITVASASYEEKGDLEVLVRKEI